MYPEESRSDACGWPFTLPLAANRYDGLSQTFTETFDVGMVAVPLFPLWTQAA